MRRNPCELEMELFCRGLAIGASCDLERDARGFSRVRAGLGSGLELVIRGTPPLFRDVWVNAPVAEPFAQDSPFELGRPDGYEIVDRRDGEAYAVRLPPQPAWYGRKTADGTEMARIGVLQGTYLGVYIGPSCSLWQEDLQCRFCATGLNIDDTTPRTVENVVETAQAAKEESGITFVHLNTGYQGGAAFRMMTPYVEALKREVGVLVGVQVTPEGESDELDALLRLGVDHFSFCFEYMDEEHFARLCPGKHEKLGQQSFLDTLAYCQKRLPRGSCSGEIIVGNEPIEATLEAIDKITALGAFPTVCVFRPLAGTPMADAPPPAYDDVRRVMQHVWDRCREKKIWIGLAPNIEASLVVQPTDTAYLAGRSWRDRFYMSANAIARQLAGPVFRRRMKPRPAMR